MSYGAAKERRGSKPIHVRPYMPDRTRYDFESLSSAWQTAAGRVGTLWCDLMHDSPMWPIHGQYQCRTCGRHYLVAWDEDGIPMASVPKAEPAQLFHSGAASLRPAVTAHGGGSRRESPILAR